MVTCIQLEIRVTITHAGIKWSRGLTETVRGAYGIGTLRFKAEAFPSRRPWTVKADVRMCSRASTARE